MKGNATKSLEEGKEEYICQNGVYKIGSVLENLPSNCASATPLIIVPILFIAGIVLLIVGFTVGFTGTTDQIPPIQNKTNAVDENHIFMEDTSISEKFNYHFMSSRSTFNGGYKMCSEIGMGTHVTMSSKEMEEALDEKITTWMMKSDPAPNYRYLVWTGGYFMLPRTTIPDGIYWMGLQQSNNYSNFCDLEKAKSKLAVLVEKRRKGSLQYPIVHIVKDFRKVMKEGKQGCWDLFDASLYYIDSSNMNVICQSKKVKDGKSNYRN